ncbi:hypothetical protein RJ640_007865, partial [Escallonia rubra]
NITEIVYISSQFHPRTSQRQRMEDQSEVVLFGMWASHYCTRVELALKLKGIPYQYVEEDLQNKSDLLLQYNPVHKKVPVMVHKGKPVAESIVILEYIDDCWSNTPRLLPDDPHERSKVRFWASYYDQKLIPSSVHLVALKGKEQEKAMENFSEVLSVFEEGIARDFPQRSPFFNGETLGFVDIMEKAMENFSEVLSVFEEGIARDFPQRSPIFNGETLGFIDIMVASNSFNYRAFSEAVGVTFDQEKHSAFFKWVHALQDCHLIKETLPPHEKVVGWIREKFFSPKA